MTSQDDLERLAPLLQDAFAFGDVQEFRRAPRRYPRVFYEPTNEKRPGHFGGEPGHEVYAL
jgi:hypothetical protein